MLYVVLVVPEEVGPAALGLDNAQVEAVMTATRPVVPADPETPAEVSEETAEEHVPSADEAFLVELARVEVVPARVAEARRQDADDPVNLSIERDRRADRAVIGMEGGLPQTMADDGDAFAPFPIAKVEACLRPH